MKSDLKRIEATLQHLALSTAPYPKSAATTRAPAPQMRRSYSFEICSTAQKRNPPEPLSEGTLTSSNSLQPAQQRADKEPLLPKFNPSIGRVHSGSNPALEMNLLKLDAAASNVELQQIVRQIEALYLEGPIVDGWLESHQSTPEARDVTLSHEADQINYLQEVYSFEQGKVTCESPRAGYRLCGLDTAGQKWSRPCPLEQLPSVSIAIARYKKLQQLLERKHSFETQLRQRRIQ